MMETVVTPAVPPSKRHQPPYSPHLKKVLKTYQLSALKSLNGPSSVLSAEDGNTKMENGKGLSLSSPSPPTTIKKEVIVTTSTGSPEGEDQDLNIIESDSFLTPAPFPIQQQPILTTPDQSKSERSETVLEGETISCFVVGGERRLCLPQILNTVLSDFTLPEINKQCDRLQIFCSRCNSKQLEVLKVSGVLPMTAPSCGLITQTDAERLCSALLHCNAPKAPKCNTSNQSFLSFRVYHECFGECQGIITPALYSDRYSRCIECVECTRLFSPQQFVCHAHRDLENQTCHWGFDSTNWRSYLLLAEGQPNSDLLTNALRDFKERHLKPSYGSSKRKQLDILPLEVKEAVASSAIPAASSSTTSSPGKRPRLHEQPADTTAATVAFNAAAAAYQLYEPYLYAAWYHDPWARLAATASTFRPWNAAPLFAKDTAAAIRDLPRLSQGPPVLLHPERVVPLSESERFERQPNVALAPVTQQYLLQKPSSHNEVKKEDGVGVVPKDDFTESKCFVSVRSSPPLSSTLRQPAYNPEIELSSDTEDSSSLVERCSDRGGDTDTTELLERLARCVANCSCEHQEEVRLQGERALRTLGVDLLASRDTRSMLAAENQILREKVIELETKLQTAASIHRKEMESMEKNLAQADRQCAELEQELSKSQEGLTSRQSQSSSVSVQSPVPLSPNASVITSVATSVAPPVSRSPSMSPTLPPPHSIKAEPVESLA